MAFSSIVVLWPRLDPRDVLPNRQYVVKIKRKKNERINSELETLKWKQRKKNPSSSLNNLWRKNRAVDKYWRNKECILIYLFILFFVPGSVYLIYYYATTPESTCSQNIVIFSLFSLILFVLFRYLPLKMENTQDSSTLPHQQRLVELDVLCTWGTCIERAYIFDNFARFLFDNRNKNSKKSTNN